MKIAVSIPDLHFRTKVLRNFNSLFTTARAPDSFSLTPPFRAFFRETPFARFHCRKKEKEKRKRKRKKRKRRERKREREKRGWQLDFFSVYKEIDLDGSESLIENALCAILFFSPPPLFNSASFRSLAFIRVSLVPPVLHYENFPFPRPSIPILPLSLPASTRQARPLEEINFNQYTVTRCVANERDREENCSSGDPLKAIQRSYTDEYRPLSGRIFEDRGSYYCLMEFDVGISCIS